MNIEILRNKGYIIFEAITGSKAYNLDIPGSDEDRKGIFVLPTKEVLAGRYVEQVSDANNDTTFYEVGRFIELASKGNPNILEIINTPEECIIYKDDRFDRWFPEETRKKFITTKLRHTFSGYAHSQLKKARGLNKKINWEEKRVTRKTPLDFCYFLFGEKSVKITNWFDRNEEYDFDTLNSCGIVKNQNGKGIYAMYLDIGREYDLRGILNDDNTSNSLRLSSIPKSLAESQIPMIFYYDEDAYKSHCRDYREYQEWLNNRNELRYNTNKKHGQNYDSKSLLHLVRLLNMAQEIGDGKGIIVRRNAEQREKLLKIRMGQVDLQDVVDNAESMIEDINKAFDNSGLPRSVNPKFTQNLLLTIRQEEYGNQ